MNEQHHNLPGFSLRRGMSAALAALVAFLLAAPSTYAAGACPNEAIREAQGTTDLPDCMALEMVSPPKKFVEPATQPTISSDGERVRFKSPAALANTPGLQTFSGDNYVATRGPGGWVTAPTSAPTAAEIWVGSEFNGGPFAYSADLSRWNLMGANPVQASAGVFRFYAGGLDGPFSPFSPLLVPIDDSGTFELATSLTSTESAATSTDLSTSVFATALVTSSLLPGDPKIDQLRRGQDYNSYVVALDAVGQPSLELLARDKDGKVWGTTCGAHLGGGSNELTPNKFGATNQGAISPDGSRIFMSTRPAQTGAGKCGAGTPTALPLRILKRTLTPAGPVIAPLLPGGQSDWEEAGDDLFQGASVDGSKVYFATTRSLVSSDQDSGSKCDAKPGTSTGCDLYLYDFDKPEGQRLSQVSLDPNAGQSANVLTTITTISGDGSRAYFVAEGELTGANAENKSPTLGEPNLYLYERDSAHPSGRTVFIATLDPADEGEPGGTGMWGGFGRSFKNDAYAVPRTRTGSGGQQIGGDGHVLAFVSRAPLSPADADGHHRDVYRYDSESEALACVSCSSAGADEGFDVSIVSPPATVGAPSSAAAVEGRWVSEDGETIAFSTAEPLAAGDDDAAENAYLWHQGQLTRLPGALTRAEGTPTLSLDGAQVAFSTRDALLPRDIDTAADVYLARTDGGFATPPPEPTCAGEACQGPRALAPSALSPSFSGPGNPRSGVCKRGAVKKRGRCVPRPRHHKQKSKKRAGVNRGGKK